MLGSRQRDPAVLSLNQALGFLASKQRWRNITKDDHWVTKARGGPLPVCKLRKLPRPSYFLRRMCKECGHLHCTSRNLLWCLLTGCRDNSLVSIRYKGRIAQKIKVAVPMGTQWDLIEGVRKTLWWRGAHTFETGRCSSGHIFMLFCSLSDKSLRLLSFLCHSLRVAWTESECFAFFLCPAACQNIWEYFEKS